MHSISEATRLVSAAEVAAPSSALDALERAIVGAPWRTAEERYAAQRLIVRLSRVRHRDTHEQEPDGPPTGAAPLTAAGPLTIPSAEERPRPRSRTRQRSALT